MDKKLLDKRLVILTNEPDLEDDISLANWYMEGRLTRNNELRINRCLSNSGRDYLRRKDRLAFLTVEAVLRKNRARAARAESVPDVLRGKPVPTAPGTVEAVAESVGRLFRRLKALNAEIKDVRKEIEKIVDRIGKMEGGSAVEILRSVPGIGSAVLAAVLSEACDSVRKADLHAPGC